MLNLELLLEIAWYALCRLPTAGIECNATMLKQRMVLTHEGRRHGIKPILICCKMIYAVNQLLAPLLHDLQTAS